MSMSRSTYQTNGKPLSQQALYQQKLRQGVYNSPSLPNVGVNSSASDAAALLAASTDLSVKPSYEREVAHEAQEAALAAKLDKVYQWSKTYSSEDAESAANNANPSSGASIKSSGVGVPPLKGGSIYKAANANSTSTMTSRVNPEKDFRSGIVPKNSSTSLNINKINSAANKNSTRTLDSRFNPDLDFRSGVKKDDANRSKTFQANDISGKYLLSAASEKASDRLNSMNSSGTPADFKAQAQLYANALAIAQKRSDERLKQNKAGVIDLGGGLTVNQAELDKMASLIVQPVLNDINTKADAQRNTDKENKAKQEELQKLHNKAKQEEIQAKNKEKADLEAAKRDRVEKNDKAKVEKDSEFEEYKKERNGEIDGQNKEKKDKEEEFKAQKEELILKKQENQNQIDEEEQGLINGRKEELDTMQAERDEIIKPTLDELKVETEKLEDLTNTKNELSAEVDELQKTNDESNTQFKELSEKLSSTEEEIEKITKELEESETKLADTTKEVDDLNKLSIDELTKVEQSNNELDTKLAEMDKEKEDNLNKKSSQKDEIKAEIDALVKGEHEVNKELPEHLRKDVDERKLRDTGSLFSDDEPEPVPEPEVKEEEKPKGKEAAPVASPSKVNGEVKPKKRSGFRKLGKLFKSDPKPLKNTPAKKEEPAKSSSGADTSKKEKAEIKSNKTSNSEDANYSDEISISKNPNKGGLFKEEI